MRTKGIYKNIDIDVYHSEEGISSTGISLILDCPARYKHASLLSQQESVSSAYVVGRALHMHLLEPDIFHKHFYCFQEELDLRTKVGKEKMEAAKATGLEVLRSQDWNTVKAMAESARKHNFVMSLFKNSVNVEDSLYWDDEGVRLRTRPDAYNDDFIIDVKTTNSIKDFERSIFSYGYHRQAAMQIDGLKALTGKTRQHVFFVIEKEAPHLTACFTLDEEALKLGRKQYFEGACIYKECLQSDIWPGYEDKVRLVSLPSYLNKDENFI